MSGPIKLLVADDHPVVRDGLSSMFAELLRAVRSAARGEVALSPSVAARLMSRLRAPAPSTGLLSRREWKC
ncbi:hypothetical protein [Microbispora sp. H10949]|uniref:hypothetical protein n=1 Tax=Microbispora sp. H10949 TaxID=2729111 RepID=UPI002872BAE2|nr:hypothetical protein [Microbispora sp. H10949]